MKYAEINKKFTEKVAEYLSMGYSFNTRTMAGRVCSGSKVDLTDGNEIIRRAVADFVGMWVTRRVIHISIKIDIEYISCRY